MCIVIAGIYGRMTAKRSILVMQALPALVALALVYAARSSQGGFANAERR